jgi:hypothetical protein
VVFITPAEQQYLKNKAENPDETPDQTFEPVEMKPLEDTDLGYYKL